MVPADAEGRLEPAALAAALAAGSGPAIVCLQAGNLHSGAFDPLGPAIALARKHGAWVHVDGAFGLWAATSPRLRHLVAGHEAADSWATDAHKTLNVPYDCGIVVVAPAGAAGGDGDAGQLPRAGRAGDPVDSVPELSRRARGVPVWAALRSLGRSGVAELVDRLAANARAIAAGIAAVPGAEVLNDVVFTQVCVAFGDDERTRAVTAPTARRRGHLDVRLALARPGRHAGLGEQLVHRRGRRGRRGRRRAPGRGRLTTKLGHQPAPVCSPSRNSSSSRTTRSNVRSISGVAVVASTSRPTEASQIS